MGSEVTKNDQERGAAIRDRIDRDITSTMEVIAEQGGLSFQNLPQVLEFAKVMAVSDVGVRKHLRGNVGACAAVVMQAIEWRLSPFAVANKSYLVNDQIAYEASILHAVVLLRAPIKGRPKAVYSGVGDGRKLIVKAELRDEPGEWVEYESPLFKLIQPKNSPLWKNDPDQQLWYYSVRAWCRRHFPDILMGVYAEDELPRDDHQGPDRARNVTPATNRNLSDKLDQLAGGKVEFNKAAAPDRTVDPPHDLETGEIIEDEAAGEAGDADDDGGAAAASEDGDQAETTLDKARAAATEGGKRWKFFKGGLTTAQQGELAPHMKDLEDLAKA